MSTTANEFCVHGRFWKTIPVREYGEEEVETLRELLKLEEESKEEEG